MVADGQLSRNASCKKLAWLQRLQPAGRLEGHEDCVNTLHWSPDGQLLVSGSDDRHLNLWHCDGTDASSMASKAPCSLETLHRDSICDAQLDRSSTSIVSCGADGCISMTGLVHPYTKMLYDQQSAPSVASKLTFTSGRVFQVAFRDGRVRQFDLRESGHRIAVDTCGVALTDVALQPLGPFLAVGSRDPFLRIYDLRVLSYQRERQASANDRPTPTLSLHIMSKLLAHVNHRSPRLNRSPRLAWQSTLGSAHTNPLDHAHASTASFTSSPFGRATVKSSQLFSPRMRIGISSVKWSNSGDLLLVNYRGSDVALFNMANTSLGGRAKIPNGRGLPSSHVHLNVVRSFEGRSNVMSFGKGVSFLSGHAAVATGGDCGGLFVWETATGALLQRLAADARVVHCVAPHPKLHAVCTSGIASEIEVWSDPQGHDAKDCETTIGKHKLPHDPRLPHKPLRRSSSAAVVGRDPAGVPKIGPWSLGPWTGGLESVAPDLSPGALARTGSQPFLKNSFSAATVSRNARA